MSAYLSPSPLLQFFDNNSNEASGYLLYTYKNLTTTPQTTYVDAGMVTPNTNPVVLDARGEASIFLPAGAVYTYVLASPTDTVPPTSPIWVQNNISSGGSVATINFADDTGTVNTYVATVSGVASLFAGLIMTVAIANTNTGPSTLNVNGSGPEPIVLQNGGALGGGELIASGQYIVQYTGTSWQILGLSMLPGLTRTPAEVAAAVTPTCYLYNPGDPRRYGVTGSANVTGTSGTDDTVAFQNCIKVALAGGGAIDMPRIMFRMLIGSPTGSPNTGLTVNFTGAGVTQNAITINGASPITSCFVQNASMTTGLLFSFTTSNAATNPTEAVIKCSNLGFIGQNKTVNGVLLQNLGYFSFENCQAYGFTNGWALQSSLQGEFNHCRSFLNNLGYIARQAAGGLEDNNLVQFRGGTCNQNSTNGFDWGAGSELQVYDLDIEGNGTSTAITAISKASAAVIAVTSTTGFLVGSTIQISGVSGMTQINGLTGTISVISGLNVTVNINSSGFTAYTSGGALANTATGAVILRATMSDEIGVARAAFIGCHFEANYGCTFQTEVVPALFLSIKDSVLLQASGTGNTIYVLGAQDVSIEDSYGAAGSVININATYEFLKNVQFGTITDAYSAVFPNGVSYPTYINVTTSAGTQRNGRTDSFTATLTGTTTTPTGSVTVNLQGDEVKLQFLAPINGTGNTTSVVPTLTGIQAHYYPATNTEGVLNVYDNGNLLALPCVISTAGTISLGYGHVFTSGGVTGIQGGTLTYRIA